MGQNGPFVSIWLSGAFFQGACLAAGQPRRQGREVLFTVRPEPLDSAARWMASIAAEWDARLARLKQLAEEG